MAHEVAVSEFSEEPNITPVGWRATCSCGWLLNVLTAKSANAKAREIEHERAERFASDSATSHRAQGFFADFAAEMRKPHFGDMQRQWMQSLLTRAIEAKLYTPEDV